MAQAYKTIHEYQSLVVASTNLNLVPAGTNLILTSAQDGNVVLLNATAGSVVNLPSPQSGAPGPGRTRGSEPGHWQEHPSCAASGALQKP